MTYHRPTRGNSIRNRMATSDALRKHAAITLVKAPWEKATMSPQWRTTLESLAQYKHGIRENDLVDLIGIAASVALDQMRSQGVGYWERCGFSGHKVRITDAGRRAIEGDA